MPANPIPPSQLVELPDSVWGLDFKIAGCQVCRKAFLLDPSQIGQPCPACWKGILSEQPCYFRSEPPELFIPGNLSKENLLSIYSRFTQGVWLPVDDLKPDNLFKRSRLVYLPMWLVDCEVIGNWQGECGFDYKVTSSQENYNGGRWQTREVIETRTRWDSRLGQLQRHYDNIGSPAVTDHPVLFSHLGAYQTQKAIRYAAKDISREMLIRVPDLDPDEAWISAQRIINQKSADECKQASEAQHIRNFSIDADYNSLHWTQLLLPMRISYYLDDNKIAQMIYINCQTGTISGIKLSSQRKGWIWAGVLAGIAFVILLLAALFFSLGVLFPPLAVVGSIAALLSLVMGVCSFIPVVLPWQWNRKYLRKN